MPKPRFDELVSRSVEEPELDIEPTSCDAPLGPFGLLGPLGPLGLLGPVGPLLEEVPDPVPVV